MACIRLSGGARRIDVAARDVRRLIPWRPLVQVPLVREGILGILVMDGRAVPIFRLAELDAGLDSGRPAAGSGAGAAGRPDSQIALFESDGVCAGLLVDSAETARGRQEESAGLVRPETLLARLGIGEAGRGRNRTDAAGAAGGESGL